MKHLFISTLAFSIFSTALACGVSRSAPLTVTCTQEDGSVVVTQVRSLYYSTEKGSLVGIGFGPNRQDDGLKVLSGECAIETTPQPAMYRN